MKQNILILCGGASPEHEISIRSAYNIYKYIDDSLFNPIIVGISHARKFYTLMPNQLENLYENFGRIEDNKYPDVVWNTLTVDICFPALHGPGGEDGSIQGYLESLNIPYIGNDVKASSICMDKDITKRILASHSLPIVPFLTVKVDESLSYQTASSKLGNTLFLKCVDQGSSIGTYKVSNEAEYNKYLVETFKFGPKVIVEKAIQGREIECAVIGNQNLETSVFGEIIPKNNHEFYDYNAKYIDTDGAQLITDTNLDEYTKKRLATIAKKAFRALDCKGLARIDFFVDHANTIFINEVNTMPGFTNISMYPKLLMRNGITYTDLITKLVHLAQENPYSKSDLA